MFRYKIVLQLLIPAYNDNGINNLQTNTNPSKETNHVDQDTDLKLPGCYPGSVESYEV